jgi:hypothetical protein
MLGGDIDIQRGILSITENTNENDERIGRWFLSAGLGFGAPRLTVQARRFARYCRALHGTAGTDVQHVPGGMRESQSSPVRAGSTCEIPALCALYPRFSGVKSSRSGNPAHCLIPAVRLMVCVPMVCGRHLMAGAGAPDRLLPQ